VDGADVVDSGSNGSTVSSPALDSIAEFKTARSSYDAQYGRGGGAQISVVTKGGTTSYHGDAFEYIRNTAFDANDYFNKNFSNPRTIFAPTVSLQQLGGTLAVRFRSRTRSCSSLSPRNGENSNIPAR